MSPQNDIKFKQMKKKIPKIVCNINIVTKKAHIINLTWQNPPKLPVIKPKLFITKNMSISDHFVPRLIHFGQSFNP